MAIGDSKVAGGMPDETLAEGCEISVVGDADGGCNGDCGGIFEGDGVGVQCEDFEEASTIAMAPCQNWMCLDSSEMDQNEVYK